MNIFIDESIHDRADFIVVAAVFDRDHAEARVSQALLECGFDPQIEEYKSSMTMASNPRARQLRNHLIGILSGCKLAIAVCPVNERPQLAKLAGDLISGIDPALVELPAVAYFDGGMTMAKLEMPIGVEVVHGCDSKKVAGIQIADCAAHLVSTMILAELGIFTKTIAAGDVYPDQDGDIELAWSLWASVRYALSSGEPVDGYGDEGWCEPMMHPFGLLVSEACSPAIKSAVEARLSSVWVGCIH